MPSPAASRRNLENARQRGCVKLYRGHDESQIIKLLVWQAWFDDEPRPSQRALARQLGVSQPYICKVMRKAHPVGWDALTRNGRTTFEELEQVRRVSARMRERAPGLFTPATRPAAHEPQPANPYRVMAHARTLRDWEQIRRRAGRRVLFSVPIR